MFLIMKYIYFLCTFRNFWCTILEIILKYHFIFVKNTSITEKKQTKILHS